MFAFLPESLLGTFCSFTSCDSMALLLSSLQLNPSAHPSSACWEDRSCLPAPGSVQVRGRHSDPPELIPGEAAPCRGQMGNGILWKCPLFPRSSAGWWRHWVPSGLMTEHNPESVRSLTIAWMRVQSPSGVVWGSSGVQHVPPDLAGGRLEAIFLLTPVKPCLPLVSCY